jgi:hypothetical protein
MAADVHGEPLEERLLFGVKRGQAHRSHSPLSLRITKERNAERETSLRKFCLIDALVALKAN